MNKEQQELLDEAFNNYWSNAKNNNLDCLFKQEEGSFLVEMRFYYKEEFINKCKTDTELSEKWGLKIEERDLSTEERNEWFQIHRNGNNPLMKSDWKDFELDQQNIPAKLITITYKNKTIESYE